MKKEILIKKLESELENLYHNATLTSKLRCESDYEADLVNGMVNDECSMAIKDLSFTCPEILNYGEVYQWGRGGRTVAPDGLIRQRGGSSFSIKSVDDLDMTYSEMRKLLTTLKDFNKQVENFCSSITDSTIEHVRQEYQDDLKQNEGKQRQHYSGVRYI